MNEQLERNLVRENLSLASTNQRVKAFIVDELLISLVIVIAFFNEISSAPTVTQAIESVNNMVLAVIALKVLYQSIFIAMYGATLGKIWQKIFVITIDGFEKPQFFTAFLRANVRIISEWFFYFGFIWAYLNPNRQTWQDKIARTIVVNIG